MKNFKLPSVFVLALLILASACNTEEEVPRGEFTSGVIVVNEGNFGDADGSFGFFNPLTETSSQDIYQAVNEETVSGLFQSIYTYDGKSYLMDQTGHKIVVVESETFKHIATISDGLYTPRYMTVANGKGYVSNWGEFGATAYVAIIDLENYVVTNTITTDFGVDGIITVGDEIYVAAAFSNVVHQISSVNDEIVGGFETPVGPKLLVEDVNGRIWVLSTEYDNVTYEDTNRLSLIDLNISAVTKTFELPRGAQRLVANGNASNLYVGFSTGVYKISADANSFPISPLFETSSLYGLGIDPLDETIYVGNSSFTGNGTIIRYNPDGTELDNYPAGRNPNGFEFRK